MFLRTEGDVPEIELEDGEEDKECAEGMFGDLFSLPGGDMAWCD